MPKSNTYKAGRHFLQVPGPTNLPDRILRAMNRPAIDHRGPQFAELSKRILERIKLIFKSSTLIYKEDPKENYLVVCKNQTCSNKIKSVEELKSVAKNYAI